MSGLRIAVAGKGGVGKTTIAGTLARLIARRGRSVLAVDLDPNPGLYSSLGMPVSDAGLPGEALIESPNAPYGWELAPDLGAAEAVERFALTGPDGVRYLTPGKISDPKHQVGRSVSAVRQILDALPRDRWDVVGDLEAGPTTPFEGYHRFADLVLVVVTPGRGSALVARGLLPILAGVPVSIVGSRFGGESDHEGLASTWRIPSDPAIAEADRSGVAPIDHAPTGPAVRAISALADALLAPLEVTA